MTKQNELRQYLERISTELRTIEEGSNFDYESIYDYLNDILDIQYILDSRMRLLGARIYVTIGGPNVWLDTQTQTIEGAWGTQRCSIGMPLGMSDKINDVLDEWVLNGPTVPNHLCRRGVNP